MEKLTDNDFKRFLEYYDDKTCEDKYHKTHKCHDTVEELSRSDTFQADSLVHHPQEMYGLDWMVKCSKKLKENPPKSTDALFFRQNYDGNYALHIIEFKFIGFTHQDKINRLWRDVRKKISCEKSQDLDDVDENSNDDECENKTCFEKNFVRNLEDIKEDFKDPIEVSLQLKPYEVIFITLPLLYEEYCAEKSTTKKDIVSYLNSIDKYYWAFVGNLSSSRYNIKSKVQQLNKYSERLEMTIFKKARVKSNMDFNKVLDREIFENFDFNIKFNNYD